MYACMILDSNIQSLGNGFFYCFFFIFSGGGGGEGGGGDNCLKSSNTARTEN